MQYHESFDRSIYFYRRNNLRWKKTCLELSRNLCFGHYTTFSIKISKPTHVTLRITRSVYIFFFHSEDIGRWERKKSIFGKSVVGEQNLGKLRRWSRNSCCRGLVWTRINTCAPLSAYTRRTRCPTKTTSLLVFVVPDRLPSRRYLCVCVYVYVAPVFRVFWHGPSAPT